MDFLLCETYKRGKQFDVYFLYNLHCLPYLCVKKFWLNLFPRVMIHVISERYFGLFLSQQLVYA